MYPDKIADVMATAFESGATGFNFVPHQIIEAALSNLRKSGYTPAISLYPMLPDTRTYANTQLRSGTLGLARLFLSDIGAAGRVKSVIQGGLSWLAADPFRALRSYLDIEVSKLHDITLPEFSIDAILMHEIVTDIMVALKLEELAVVYIEQLRDKQKVVPGFVTRNLPKFLQFFEEFGLPIDDVMIMTPFNKVGFQMAPSKSACENALKLYRPRNVVGMSILAAGRVDLGEAIKYVKAIGLDSVCVGVSTNAQAKETFCTLRKELFAKPF
jgi:hypothetical protein